MVVEIDHLCEKTLLCTRGMTVSRSVYGKAPKRQLHNTPIALSESGHSGNETNCHPYTGPPHMWFLVGCNSPFMRLAARRTPHGASRLVQAISAWSVQTRRAPSWHCNRDAKVYCHTTAAMHDIEHNPPTPPRPLFPQFCSHCG